MSFCVLDDFFRFFKKFGFSAIPGPPYCGIGATIRIGREMLCLLYAGFFLNMTGFFINMNGSVLNMTGFVLNMTGFDFFVNHMGHGIVL